MQLKKLINKSTTKRGDTMIEVIFAFAVFCMVTVVSIAMMNMGMAVTERSLELVTARNELNAQAEALRFVHSSYISEMSLPICKDSDGPDVKCQQYRNLWTAITDRSVDSSEFNRTMPYPPEVTGDITSCEKFYTDNRLYNNNAFILNTRQLLAKHNSNGGTSYNDTDAIIPAEHYDVVVANNTFVPATLNARIIYTDDPSNWEVNNSTTEMQSLFAYTRVAKVEGIWVIAVKGPAVNVGAASIPRYYDFYIETCWYGSGNNYPTALDTIIRLYNPQGATS